MLSAQLFVPTQQRASLDALLEDLSTSGIRAQVVRLTPNRAADPNPWLLMLAFAMGQYLTGLLREEGKRQSEHLHEVSSALRARSTHRAAGVTGTIALKDEATGSVWLISSDLPAEAWDGMIDLVLGGDIDPIELCWDGEQSAWLPFR